VQEPVSLADVTPTLAEVAREGRSEALARPVDGRSLVPLLGGGPESADATVYGEYLAESVLGPMVMIRRGPWKFIHAASDEDQLFELSGDPLELVNVAGEPAHAQTASAFREEVDAHWDLEAIERSVRESQQARLAVFEALQVGQRHPWDYQPTRQASSQYTRNTMDVAERDQQSRYPPVPAP
jgi:choline-sulfatase